MIKEAEYLVFDSEDSQWDITLKNVRLSDIHFTSAYHKLYELNGDGKAKLFVFKENNQTYVYPFLLRPIPVGLGADSYFDIETVYGYTGPYATTKEISFLENAAFTFREYCKEKNIISEFVRFHPILENHIYAAGREGFSLIKLRDYVFVDLTKSLEDLRSEYTSANRNKIRKAEKAGCDIEFGKSRAAFEDFKRIYIENMQRLNASRMYFFSEAWFEGLFHLIQNNGIIARAIINGTTEGATVFFSGAAIGHYFLSSATVEGKKHAVSNIMLDRGIEWAKSYGMKFLHLGGGLTGAEDDPLLVFKLNFSHSVKPFYIGKQVHNNDVYKVVIAEWEKRYPLLIEANKAILQRYHLSI